MLLQFSKKKMPILMHRIFPIMPSSKAGSIIPLAEHKIFSHNCLSYALYEK